MRKIRNTMLFLHALLLSALFLAGCVREEFPGSGSVAEGKPSQVAFNLVIPAMSSSPSTRAMTPEEERKIENLRVMVFRADGSVVSNDKYAGTGNQFTVNSYSGSNYTLLFIANVNSAEIEARLQSAASLSDMEQFVTTATQQDFGLNTTHPLMMIGKQENVTFAPGNSTYGTPVQLHFIAAKVTLKVIDNTANRDVSIIGWDVEDAPARSYLFPQTKDVNEPGTTADSDNHWLTTDVDYPFETVDASSRTVSQTLYVFENRRGGRANRPLPDNPDNQYTNMDFNDQDHRGKAWFKPLRATAIVIKAMHKTTAETKQVKAHIYLGADNHSDYTVERGKHYTFTVTVNGLDDIKVDSNVEYYTGDFLVDYGDNLTMDTHPDFRPMRIHATKGVATMEILDENRRPHNDPLFSATWLKISPLNLMYHQVKQTGDAAKWQQDADPTSRIVRGRYIPHTSVRDTLPDTKKWWTAHSDIATTVTRGDDDVMTFANATYRMCYKITDIRFADPAAVTSQTLYVYADEYHQEEGAMRNAFVRFTFLKDGNGPDQLQERIFNINQDGYIRVFDEANSEAGLTVLKEDATSSGIKKKFVFEKTEEAALVMNPGIAAGLQRTITMQWGFFNMILYGKGDFFRNGKLLTAHAVYTDVQRSADHEPIEFGKTPNSYRDMYGRNAAGGTGFISAYTGTDSGSPYYYPDASGQIYHPIYKSSAARYCHEKNRDVNGDGIIDDSEAKWYLPAMHEMMMAYVQGLEELHKVSGSTYDLTYYWSVSENNRINSNGWYVSWLTPNLTTNSKKTEANVRCARHL